MGKRKRYSAEFKREALRQANHPGVTDVLVAEELGINARQLRHGLRACELGPDLTPLPHDRAGSRRTKVVDSSRACTRR